MRRSLDAIFRPRSVAVIGASGAPGSVGAILTRNLLGHPFGGGVYPVNPKRRTVLGVQCYPDLSAVPEAVDLVVIAVPAPAVPAVVADCAGRGVPAAIIVSAGFSGRGAEGRALEDQIRAARGTMRVLGPSPLGVLHPPCNLNASVAAAMALPGRVALLSQSGAICTSILDWALERRVGFSGFVGVGRMIDVDFADLLDYFGDDPATKAVLIYMESIGDVRKFLSAARGAGRTKHVIVVKAGARAAASHTRVPAGSDAAFDAAFRRAGVLRVTTIPDLFHMAEVLSMQPPPRGPDLAVVTNAGGPGVMAVDDLTAHGGRLAAPCPETMAALDAALPPHWSHANPIDLLSDATPDRYRLAVELCAKDPAVRGVLVLLAPQAATDPTGAARAVAAACAKSDKPVLGCWMGGATVRPGREVLNAAGIPTYDAPEDAVRAFLHMVQYRRNQELLYETPPALPEDWRPDAEAVRRIIGAARSAGRTLLTEAEAKQMLAAYGLPVAPAVACRTADEGYELIVGSSVDRQFGPVVLFGTGGVLAEVLRDQATALPPLNRTLARRLMERTRVYTALQGVRGRKPVDLEALETMLARFSQLLTDFVEDIQEVDLNPVLAAPGRIVAPNPRVLLPPPDRPRGERPRLAVQPYPNQYTAPHRLRDGTEVVVRAIRPEDEPLLVEMHAHHSDHTIRMRYFSMVRTLSRDSLIRLCHLDYDREMALTAVRRDGGTSQMLGVSRYYLNPETGEAEFALVVGDAFQGKGLGRHLLKRLIDVARERGVRRLVGLVLHENEPMLTLTKSLGFRRETVEDGVVRMGMGLEPPAPAQRISGAYQT